MQVTALDSEQRLDQRIEVFGPKGALETTNLRTTGVRFSGAEGTDLAGRYLPFFLERYAAAYTAELGHFISSIEAGTAPSPSVLDGRAALVIAEAAGQSVAGHTMVPVA